MIEQLDNLGWLGRNVDVLPEARDTASASDAAGTNASAAPAVNHRSRCGEKGERFSFSSFVNGEQVKDRWLAGKRSIINL